MGTVGKRGDATSTSVKRPLSHPTASNPAPQANDQSCGADGDAAFVDRMRKFAPMVGQPHLMQCLSEEFSRLIALASRPAPAEAVRVLVEALKLMTKYARWQYKEGGSHHPTLGSAIASANEALNHPAVRAALSGDPWQPISTAPRDGTKFLAVSLSDLGKIYDPDEQFVARFERGNFLRKQGTSHPAYVCHPTHWTFLPALPVAPQKEPGA